MTDKDLTETCVGSTEIFDGKIVKLFCDDIILPNGKSGKREYIKHVGAVAVVPLTEKNEVVTERQFRYPFHSVLTEIPAGKLDSKTEDPLEAAKRELREETGAEADELMFMGNFYPTCAYSDEVIGMYLARGLHFGERNLDEDEFLNVETVPLESLVQDILSGKIQDGKTQTAVMKAYLLLKNEEKEGN